MLSSGILIKYDKLQANIIILIIILWIEVYKSL